MYLVIEFLKRSLAVFLSFSLLFFKGPICFAMGNDDCVELTESGCFGKRSSADSFNPKRLEEGIEDSNRVSREESDKVNLLPLDKKDGDDTRDKILRSYAARKIYNADLGRNIEHGDYSRVKVPTQDFFLYPPKNVKELFELSNKYRAAKYRDSVMDMDIARHTKTGCCSVRECGRLTCKSIVNFIMFVLSSFTAVGALTAWYLQACERMGSDSDVSSDLTLGDFFRDPADKIFCAVFIASLILFSVSCYNTYKLSSRAYCDCYMCKPSASGCSCGYGCLPDKEDCVCCSNCFGCKEDSCCLAYCPCDNGGLAVDCCGSYGIGSCCGKMYNEFASDSVKDVNYFKKFINSVKLEVDIDGDGMYKCREILMSATLDFKKSGRNSYRMSAESSGNDTLGLNYSDGRIVLPAAVRKIFQVQENDNLSDGVEAKYRELANRDITALEGILSSICRQNMRIQGSEILEQLKRFILVVLHCLQDAETMSELDRFSQVRLYNFFNFLLALYECQTIQGRS